MPPSRGGARSFGVATVPAELLHRGAGRGQDQSRIMRDPETLKRIWIKPGTPGLTHRIGGIERSYTGEISYDPANHQKMTDTRKAKIDGIANSHPRAGGHVGHSGGKLAVVGWGSTFGPIQQGVRRPAPAAPTSATSTSAICGRCPAISRTLLRSYEKDPGAGNEYRPAQDGSARPVSHRRQTPQQGFGQPLP